MPANRNAPFIEKCGDGEHYHVYFMKGGTDQKSPGFADELSGLDVVRAGVKLRAWTSKEATRLRGRVRNLKLPQGLSGVDEIWM